MLKFDKAGKNNHVIHWFLDIGVLKLCAFNFYLMSAIRKIFLNLK